ncbi:MAG: hypothetical protein HY901_24945 [Deltaproteobacteria bacterium]|nr:hypothetical protein [Deltaproteobacteria bacterium]
MRALSIPVVLGALVAFIGCSSGDSAIKKTEIADDGLPAWVSDPCAGISDASALCAVAESAFAAADVEAAKTDAETVCKNRLADQVTAKVGRLTERLNSAMKDLSNGRTVGEHTIKDINQSYQQTTLHGLRYGDYFFWPSRTEPKKVWVRAYVTVDSNKMSQDIVNAMMAGAQAERLELKHEEAQMRFDAVRQKYLEEEKAQQGSAPAR